MKQHEAIFPLKTFLRNTRSVPAAQRAPKPVLTAGKEPRPRQPAGPGPAKHVLPPTGRQRGGEPADNFSPLRIFNAGRLRAAPQRPPHGGARPLAGCARGGGRLAGAGKGEGRRERSQRPPSLTHSPVGLAAPVPAAAPKLKAMRGRGVWVLPGRTGGASGTTPPQAFCVVPPGGAPPALPALGLYHCGGRGGTTGCEGGELLEAEGSLLGVGLSLRELKSSGLSLNIVFSFPKCHVLSSHWAGKEGNTTATRR